MKAIVIKINGKVVFCEQIREITTTDFIKLQEEVGKTWREKDEKVVSLESEVSRLNACCNELEEKVADLYHQIAIDRGEAE